MTECNLCGTVMIQLQGWDFKLDVCLNHEPPHFISQNWCQDAKNEDRELREHEIALINDRAIALGKRLTVVNTPKEIWTAVICFLFGGWKPEIDERITKVRGEHL
jgi:hypothetical protein